MKTRFCFLAIVTMLAFWSSVSFASDRTIVLTFDDGPRPKAFPELLDLLRKEKIPAAFFLQAFQINEAAAKNKKEAEEIKRSIELLRIAYRAGYEIANHTYGHGALCSMMSPSMRAQKDIRCITTKGKLLADIERGQQLIEKVIGTRPLFFRPPHWLVAERYKTIRTFGGNKFPKSPCDIYQKKSNKNPAERKVYLEMFPPDTIFKEEITCEGYLVQMLDNPQIFDALLKELRDDPKMRELYQRERETVLTTLKEQARNMREVRDVNTTDYSFQPLYQKDPEKAVSQLLLRVRQIIRGREKAGIRTHILVFHELPITIQALKVLIPEWRKSGYQFQTLRWAWGI